MYEGCKVYDDLIEQRRVGRKCEITGEGQIYKGHDFVITQEPDESAAGFQWRVADEGEQARKVNCR